MSTVDIDSQRNRRTQIVQAIKKKRGERKVLNCCTFKTEGSKSALLTAARGMGIDNDIAQYLANMIPITRGFTWPLEDVIHGNVEEDRKPVTEFINEVANYPGLLETAMNIEGLVNGRSIHASAVYLFNEDFTAHNARMKAPNGTYITQFNMKDSDYCSGLKMDFLTISSLDAIRHCMDMLLASGHMQWQGTLRDTYNKYLHPDVLDYDTKEMWDWVAENKVVNLFQFDTQVGLQAVKRIRPHNLTELATANSIMRLMASEQSPEQPIDTYIRYKNDLSQWYSCMKDEYHLTEEEIKIVEPYLLPVYGVGDTQEIVMELSMDNHIAGFDVAQSNKLRKGISKKDKNLQAAMKKMFFEHGKEIHTSENLLRYIWQEVIGKQLGYSFSKNHTMPYACIALQELNLAYHYPIIYWNCSCLIVDAGADEEVAENKSTNYGKIATAMSNMQHRGINISFPLINEAEFEFIPDEQNNRIIYSLKAINGIGDDVVREIIKQRNIQPFSSMQNFLTRMYDTSLVKKSQMIQLIKAGAFIDLDSADREKTMQDFLLSKVVTPVEKLGLAQFDRMIDYDQKYHFIPDGQRLCIKHKYFKEYVLNEIFLYQYYIDPQKKLPKKGYHDRWFKLDQAAMSFFQQNYSEDSIEEVEGNSFIISEKKFLKEYEQKMVSFKMWLQDTKTIINYNRAMYQEAWEKYAGGSLSKWDMDALTVYMGQHELAGLKMEQYGVVNFFNQSEEPTSVSHYIKNIVQTINGVTYKTPKKLPIYQIVRLAGTVIDKNKDRHLVSLLTTDGVVTLKFNKGQFLYYDKQISEVKEDGTKEKQESSWFSRGNKILVSGYRQGDQFRIYKYANSIYKHTCYLIKEVKENGDLVVANERVRTSDGR